MKELLKLNAGVKCIDEHSEWEEGNLAFFLSILMQIVSYATSLLTNFVITHIIHSIFFEKLRLLESRDKSEARLRNEKIYPFGFSTKKSGTEVHVQNDDDTVYLI